MRLRAYTSPSAARCSSRTALALMVMPRSRSRSMVSSNCSRMSRSATVPVRWRKRSASVDLPWSMWAMMQKLRMRARSVIRPQGRRWNGSAAQTAALYRGRAVVTLRRSRSQRFVAAWPTSSRRSSATARTRGATTATKAVRSELKTRYKAAIVTAESGDGEAAGSRRPYRPEADRPGGGQWSHPQEHGGAAQVPHGAPGRRHPAVTVPTSSAPPARRTGGGPRTGRRFP